MKYLLDTNICIHFLRGKFNIDQKIKDIGFINCAISEITFAELIYGAEYSPDREKNIARVESFAKNLNVIPIINCISLYGKKKPDCVKLAK